METIQTPNSENFVSLAEGIKREGETIGAEKEKMKVAYRLIIKGYKNKFIIDVTGLPEDEIDKLRELKKFKDDL